MGPMTDQDRSRRYRFADVDLDPGQRTVTRSGKPVRVGKLTFDFLSVLVQRAPNVVTHDELAKLVWPRRIVTPENMTQRVALLRQALGDTAKHPKFVRVVHGQGYQLIPPVAVVPPAQVVPSAQAVQSRMTRRASVGASIVAAVALIALIGVGSSTARRFIEGAAGANTVASETASAPQTPNAPETASTPATGALQRWRTALRQNPDDQNALVGLGTLLCASGHFTEALGHLRKAQALYGDSIAVLEALARCLVASSDYEGAKAVIAHGVELNPRFRLRASPVNPGFEEGMYGWGLTYDKGYRAGPNLNFDFAIDTSVARSGGASGRLRSAIGGGQAAVISAFVPAGFLGGKVRMSAYLKTEHVEQEAHLWLRVDSALPGGIDTTYFENTANRPLIRGDTDWTRYEIVAEVPKTAAYINYGYGMSGTGTVWIDDVQFEPVSATTPLTGLRLPEPKLLPHPENLDFGQGLTAWTTRGAPDVRGHTGNIRALGGAAALTVYDSEREIRQDVSAGKFAGHRVRLSVKLKRQTSTGVLRAEMWLRTASYSASGQAFANRWMADGDKWKRYDLVVDVPETSTKLAYWISAGGQGTLLVDDVRLEAVDPSVPLTTMPAR